MNEKSILKLSAVMIGSIALVLQGCGGSRSLGGTTPPGVFVVTTRSAQNGTIFTSSNNPIVKGGVGPTISATGNPGYIFNEWLIDGVATPNSGVLSDGTTVKISEYRMALGNLSGSHVVSANFVKSVWCTLGNFDGATNTAPHALYCNSNMSFVLFTSGFTTGSYALSKLPGTPYGLATLHGFNQIWGVNENGWTLYSDPSGVNVLDPTGAVHSIVSNLPAYGQYAINDAGTVMFDETPTGNAGQPAQFYTQSGWDSSTAKPISSDIQGYFLNNAGTIIGTSYGLNSIPKGTPVAYINGQEVALPQVEGTFSAFSNTGVLVTVPSPGTVNVYTNNGQSRLATISNLVVDTVSGGTGPYPNPYNRIVGCNAAGDIKIIGQSTATATSGDWGYWDSGTRSFVDVNTIAQSMITGPPINNLIARLWSISDNDEICATIGPSGLPQSPVYSNSVLEIFEPSVNPGNVKKLERSVK